MLKVKFVFITLFCILVNSIYSQICTEQLNNDSIKRELLKEYFLCVCMTESFKDIKQNDISLSVYFDIIGYSPKAFEEINKFAKKFIKSIEPSIIEDLGNKKNIIMLCIEKYKSKELDLFTRRLDKYLLKE